MESRSSGAKRSWRRVFVICGVASLVVTYFFLSPQLRASISNEMEVHHEPVNHHDIIETVPVTIVCQLSGEMGNNLAKLGRCLSLKWWLESGAFYNSTDKLGYAARVALRHQDHNKWVRGAKDLQRCFPNTNQFDFSEANNPEFESIWKMQHKLLGGNERVSGTPPFNEINTVDAPFPLQSFVSEVSKRHSLVYNTASKRNVSLPFLFSDYFQSIDALADRFYQESRQFFHFNESCCTVKADPDENVFHYRNFKKEMPKRWNGFGFHEADPQQAANEVFGHLKEGDKVAIVTRFGGESAQPYVDAFEARGLKVRVVDGNDGPADFCFLMSAQKEIAGMAISTYFAWAGYLGNATRVISYQMASSKLKILSHHNCTSKGLRGKFDFVTLNNVL
mmetsp:Transcript_2701/g.3847  ORF Transcript_2701/g.3847 Transcript_2701/m.3847 type:complete len:392 (+) Transcript_2701:160-1335(+)